MPFLTFRYNANFLRKFSFSPTFSRKLSNHCHFRENHSTLFFRKNINQNTTHFFQAAMLICFCLTHIFDKYFRENKIRKNVIKIFSLKWSLLALFRCWQVLPTKGFQGAYVSLHLWDPPSPSLPTFYWKIWVNLGSGRIYAYSPINPAPWGRVGGGGTASQPERELTLLFWRPRVSPHSGREM